MAASLLQDPERETASATAPSHARQSDGLDFHRILGLTVPLSVTIAEREMSVQSILEMAVGTIIEFDVPVEADLTLKVADTRIGSGQAIKVGENFGLRIQRIGTVQERIGAMGK